MRIGIIGAGNMAKAILTGIVETNKNVEICCSDISSRQLSQIKTTKKIKTTNDNKKATEKSTIVFLCVKPNIIKKVAEEIRPFLQKKQVLISVAAGVSLTALENFFGHDKKIIRTMPNLPCLIGKGVVATMPNSKCTRQDKTKATKLLSSVGEIVPLNRDEDFDYITALSGSGPAFLAEYIAANLSFAKKKKINNKLSQLLVFETIAGTIEFLKYNNPDINKFISMVASPGGTTEEGLKSLKKSNYSKVVSKALSSAAKRSYQISKEIEKTRKKK